MKKVKFVLPLVAVVFAVAGVFATGKSEIANVLQDVSANTGNCIQDGRCDQSTGATCTLKSNSAIVFNIITGIGAGNCQSASTGVFVAP